MKTLLLTTALLSTFSLSAMELPYYDYQIAVRSDNNFELQSNGSLAPIGNYGEGKVTVNGVETKLMYEPISRNESFNGKTTKALLMYITEDKIFALSAYTKACGKFDYQSKVIPTKEPLTIKSSKGCTLDLKLSVHKFKS